MTLNKDSNEILIVAAEASSALYAQRLLEHWQAHKVPVKAFGVGSKAMEKLGFHILGRAEEMAVVGIQEILSHYGDIRRVYYKLIEEVKRRKPKVILLLDYPEFNLKLAQKLKPLGIPIVFYISPQVWAWREGRVKKIRKVVDKMLVLFPFEKGFYEKHGVPVEFVGHPLLDELKDIYFQKDYSREHRQRYGISGDDLVLALLPGSRKSEIRHHLTTQIQVAEQLHKKNPKLKVILCVAPSLDRDYIKSLLGDPSLPLILVKEEPFQMICLADVVLCASGTATLLVGLLEKPLLIMYQMNGFTAWIARRFVKQTKFFGMVNIIMGEEVGKEFFQEEASVPNLSEAIEDLLSQEELRVQVSLKLKQLKDKLGKGGATARVSEILEEYFRKES